MITNRSVLNLIRNAINCGWSQEDRKVIIQETWSEIRELSVTMLDEAILIGMKFISVFFFFKSFVYALIKRERRRCAQPDGDVEGDMRPTHLLMIYCIQFFFFFLFGNVEPRNECFDFRSLSHD